MLTVSVACCPDRHRSALCGVPRDRTFSHVYKPGIGKKSNKFSLCLMLGPSSVIFHHFFRIFLYRRIDRPSHREEVRSSC